MYVLVMLSEILNAGTCPPNCMLGRPRRCNINICDCGTLILFWRGLILQDIHHGIFIFVVFPCDINAVYILYSVGLLLKFRTFLCLLCVVLWLSGMGLDGALLSIRMLLKYYRIFR